VEALVMKLISLVIVGATTLVSLFGLAADAVPNHYCTKTYVGQRCDICNIVMAFDDCEGDYKKMEEVLAVRFKKMKVSHITMRFFKWITMAIDEDYKTAGAQNFFRLMLGGSVPTQYLRRLSQDKQNWEKMRTIIPLNNCSTAPDLLVNKVKSSILISSSVTTLAATIYDITAEGVGHLMQNRKEIEPTVEHVLGILRNLMNEVQSGNDAGLGKLLSTSGLDKTLGAVSECIMKGKCNNQCQKKA